ncbi:protease SohB [Halothiobacillus sp. DCM-1]|uniref:protease SohB n=1 Tax=Halothiobacillus sp. DCM-1 TaxID=3112558 RepID=UPI00324B92D7
MGFWAQYGLFLIQLFSVLLMGVLLVMLVARARGRGARGTRQDWQFESLNQTVQTSADALARQVLDDRAWKRRQKQQSEDAKARKKTASTEPQVFVLSFTGDLRASAVEALREEITVVLSVARPAEDEVLLLLESPGGLVTAYGLAAAQLARLRVAGIRLTVAVDKVAASGGYMMAAVADHIVAAPFAVVGSIGVVAQLPNVHRLLQRHEIDIELHTAGQYKRTLTVLGENTEEGREKFRMQLNETHDLFKAFLQQYRPVLDLSVVATGEYWFGQQALALNLVDELATSDAWISARLATHQFTRVRKMARTTWLQRVRGEAQAAVTEATEQLWDRWRHKLEDPQEKI